MTLQNDILFMCRFHPHTHPYSFAPGLLLGLNPLLITDGGLIHSHSWLANRQRVWMLLSLWSVHSGGWRQLPGIQSYLQVIGRILLMQFCLAECIWLLLGHAGSMVGRRTSSSQSVLLVLPLLSPLCHGEVLVSLLVLLVSIVLSDQRIQ